MEEKILVKSEQYNIRKIFFAICLVGLIIGLVIATVRCGQPIKNCSAGLAEYTSKYETGSNSIWASYYKDSIEDYADSLAYWRMEFVKLTAICFLAAVVIGGILYFALSRIELVVSNKRVFGCAAFGKRVDLPLDSVSAIGSKWPKGIVVATSSGRIAFLMIKNRDELHKCISDLLIERQSKPVTATTPVATIKQEIPQSNADELKKYKDLLDSGVITQEEFDAKKKQLLGL